MKRGKLAYILYFFYALVIVGGSLLLSFYILRSGNNGSAPDVLTPELIEQEKRAPLLAGSSFPAAQANSGAGGDQLPEMIKNLLVGDLPTEEYRSENVRFEGGGYGWRIRYLLRLPLQNSYFTYLMLFSREGWSLSDNVRNSAKAVFEVDNDQYRIRVVQLLENDVSNRVEAYVAMR